jgi:hypothetical protein
LAEEFNNLTKVDASKVDEFYDEINKTEMTMVQYQDLLNKLESLKENLKDGVFLSDSDFKALLKYIVSHDVTSIREYIKCNSTISFQKDFFMDPIEKYIYKSSFNSELRENGRDTEETSPFYSSSNVFNNDSAFLEFNQDMILLTCAECTLFDNNYDYYTDVFVNGKLLSRDQYYERPSNVEYNFVGFHTGARRIFINRIKTDENNQLVTRQTGKDGTKEYVYNIQTDDLVSLVVHRCPSMSNSFYYKYTITNIDNNIINFTVLSSKIGGTYGDITNANIIIFRKNKYDNYIPLSNSDYHIENGENSYVLFSVANNEDLSIGDELLIVNKSNYLEGTFISDEYDNIEDYIMDGLKNCRIKPFITINDIDKFPIPFTNDEELEIYVNGLRLVPKVDYFSVIDEEEGLYIQLTALLKSKSEIVIRNKCFAYIDSKNTDVDQVTDTKDRLTSLYKIHDKLSYDGFVWMEQNPFPIHPGYIEAYVGRHRIPFIYKRYVCNKCLKIDRQIYENHLETYSEILWDNMMIEYLLDGETISLDPADHLYSFDPNLVESGWLYKKKTNTYSENEEETDISYNTLPNFYTENHPLKPNVISESEDNPFNGKIIGIKISTEPSLLKESEDVVFKVYLVVEIDDYDYDIEVTQQLKDFITITGFDRTILHEDQTVVGKLLVSNLNNTPVYDYSDTIIVNIAPKEIVSFDLYPTTNFFMSGEGSMYKTVDNGDKVLESLDVIINFEDGSEKILKASNGTIIESNGNTAKMKIVDTENSNLIAYVTGPITANDEIGYERVYLSIEYYDETTELPYERYVMLTTHPYIAESEDK